MVLVWLDWLVLCEYDLSVSALWCPLATPTVLLEFLLPWAWGISSRLLQQSAAIAPYLGWGVSPHCCPSWLSTWDNSSSPSCAHAATAPWTWGWSSWPPPLASGLECGVPPPGSRPWPRTRGNSSRHRPWPRTWDNSSSHRLWPRMLGISSGPLPKLRRGVAPLGHSCAIAVWYSRLLPLTSDVG